MCVKLVLFFCFKQKTAYEMRISDWSSDVCSSDLMTQADGFEFVQAVAYLGPEYLLAVTWKDGQTEEVDLAPLVFRYRILRPLRNLDAFRRVAVDEYGNGLVWGDDPDLAVAPEQLRALSEEQRGPRMRNRFFRRWMAPRNPKTEEVEGLVKVQKRTGA